MRQKEEKGVRTFSEPDANLKISLFPDRSKTVYRTNGRTTRPQIFCTIVISLKSIKAKDISFI